jgi:DNA-binding transcriptional regulator YiaG
LRKIMRDRGWGPVKVATLLDREVDTVRKWTCDDRQITDHALRLLQILADREREAVGV